MKKNPESRICVIGAGAAGLSAAYYLKEKGYRNVTVLEREKFVGGKCRSLNIDGINHDMGAVEFTPFYRHTISLMKKLGVAHAPVARMKIVDIHSFRDYGIWTLFGDAGIISVVWAMAQYLFLLLKNGRYLRKPGFRGLPHDLTLPFTEWLAVHGLEPITNLFLIPLTCYGYGRLEDIPAAYVLKYINFRNMATMISTSALKMCGISRSWPRRVAGGFQHLLLELEKALGCVRTGVRITGVARNGKNRGGVLINLACEAAPLEFDALIVAFPPETSAVESISLDMSPGEKSLFDKIIHQPYFTTACRVKGLEPGIHLALVNNGCISVPGTCSPLLVYRQTDRSDVAVVYTSIDRNDERTETEMIGSIEDSIGRILSGAGLDVEILETLRWNYFPHADMTDLREGFYGKLESMQGENNTYYAGALLNFESVEHVVEYSKRLVEKFFSN